VSSPADIFNPVYEYCPFAPVPPLLDPGDLGLGANDNVDGFSAGSAFVTTFPPPPGSHLAVQFSVDRASAGTGAIATQVAGNGAAGDIFEVFCPVNQPCGAPTHAIDAAVQGPQQFNPNYLCLAAPGADVDAWENNLGFYAPPDSYFSLDPASATANGVLPGDVLVNLAPPGGPFVVYATAAALGLAAGDDIDALAVNEAAGGRGTWDPGDSIYLSLTPASPSAAGLGGPAAIVQVHSGSGPAVWATPGQLGLLATDNLDALTVYDPSVAGGIPTLTEWGLIVLVLLLAIGLTLVWGRQPALATAGGPDVAATAPALLVRRLFYPTLAATAALALSALVLALGLGAEVTGVDVGGTLVCVPLVAFLVHQWIALRRS
jgi:hypothetical protein